MRLALALALSLLAAPIGAPPPAPSVPPPREPPAVGALTTVDGPCLASAGYQWCAATRACVRLWETPCKDNYDSCADCLASQRQGINIACPRTCDVDPTATACVCPPPPPCPLSVPSTGCRAVAPPTDDCGCAIGCPALRCSEGALCGGFAGGVCESPFVCVATMGPLVADAPGRCVAPCATARDAYGNCIAPGCKVWFDGCNTCRTLGEGTACTERACAAPTTDSARCLDDHDKPAAAGEVCHRFCEDGSAPPVHADCADGLACVAPAGVGFDSCGERASRCVAVDGH
jgi:hypothetical protein